MRLMLQHLSCNEHGCLAVPPCSGMHKHSYSPALHYNPHRPAFALAKHASPLWACWAAQEAHPRPEAVRPAAAAAVRGSARKCGGERRRPSHTSAPCTRLCAQLRPSRLLSEASSPPHTSILASSCQLPAKLSRSSRQATAARFFCLCWARRGTPHNKLCASRSTCSMAHALRSDQKHVSANRTAAPPHRRSAGAPSSASSRQRSSARVAANMTAASNAGSLSGSRRSSTTVVSTSRLALRDASLRNGCCLRLAQQRLCSLNYHPLCPHSTCFAQKLSKQISLN